MVSQIKPLKKGLIIVPSYFPTSYLLAVPPSLCSPFLVSSLPSNRQHPIPLHSLLTKKLTITSRHNPCICHHSSLYLNSEGFFFSLFGTLNQWRNKRGVDVPFYLKIQCLDGRESDPCLDFFLGFVHMHCTEGPQR